MADNLLSSFLPDDRAAFGVFPQMKPRRRLQDPAGAANVPLDVTRGRVAGLAGLLPDVLNFMGRSPMPTEQFGETQYEPAQQLPYGSEYFLQNLPLKPTSRIGEVAGQAGAFVPLNPMPAARAAAVGVKALGPTAGRMAEGYLQRQGLMPSIVPNSSKQFNVVNRDASEIFGAGAERLRYTDPASGGSIEVLKRPDNTASVLSLEVPESFRGKGIGESLQAKVLQDFPQMQGQVSSKAAAKTAYRLGRRPPNQPNASLDDVYKIMDENSSVNLVSPQMQRSFSPTFQYPQQAALDLAQQRAALPAEQGGLGLPVGNTAEQRAAAQYGKDMVHFSRAGGDYTTLDSGKFAIAPFDAVGTHVGTPQAAMERYQNTVGYKVNNPNYANDELKGVTYPVTILGDRPLMNQNGMPFGEDDLNAFLRQQGGHNWSDIQGGKMTYQDMNAKLRKKLFEEQGYTSIPYYNEVEGKGSISYIVPPDNIRSRFAAYDPFRRNAAIAAAMGVAAPDLLAAQPKQQPSQNSLNSFIR